MALDPWKVRHVETYSGLVLTTKRLMLVFAVTFAVNGQVDAPFEANAHKKIARPEWKVQEPPAKARPAWANPFYIGEAMVIGGMAADIGSSWGCLESNPLLRSANGRFGGRG